MLTAQNIVHITTHTDEDAYESIGAKAASRAILTHLRLPTPAAFVITPLVFYQFLHEENGLNKWRSIINSVRVHDPEHVVHAARELQRLVQNHRVTSVVADPIFKAYETAIRHHWAHLTISPTKNSKAPVNYPMPVIKGETALIEFLRHIWSAQLTPHALSLHLTVNPSDVFAPAPILVSEHEPATASGTITTIDPLTHDKNLIRIEAIWGTNPSHDPQSISTDTYIIAKQSGEVISRQIATQEEMITTDRFGHYKTVKVPHKLYGQPKLNQDQITTLIRFAQKVHDFSLKAQTINWLTVDKNYPLYQIFFCRNSFTTTADQTQNSSKQNLYYLSSRFMRFTRHCYCTDRQAFISKQSSWHNYCHETKRFVDYQKSAPSRRHNY